MGKLYQYYVEGECEEKLINALKTPPVSYMVSGKVDVFNVITKKLSKQRIMSIKPKAIIILVYDIDEKNLGYLDENIKLLKDSGFKSIFHIQSVRNFEDEIKFSTKIKSIHDIFETQGIDEFKSRFIHCSNLMSKLNMYSFDKTKLWSRTSPVPPFNKYSTNKIIND